MSFFVLILISIHIIEQISIDNEWIVMDLPWVV